VTLDDPLTGPAQHPDQVPVVALMSSHRGERQVARLVARRPLIFGQIMTQAQENALALLEIQRREGLSVQLLDKFRRSNSQQVLVPR
jgi:hypothetical protein